jgi:hypothetical protein
MSYIFDQANAYKISVLKEIFSWLMESQSAA